MHYLKNCTSKIAESVKKASGHRAEVGERALSRARHRLTAVSVTHCLCVRVYLALQQPPDLGIYLREHSTIWCELS